MKTLKFLLVAVIFFVAGFFLGQSYQIPTMIFDTPKDVVEIQEPLTYIISFDETNLTEFQNVAIEQRESVLDLLQKLTLENELSMETKDYGDLGTLVTKIGDTENGQDNKYWIYYINGEMAQIGADNYLLKGGERIEWKFEEYQEGMM